MTYTIATYHVIKIGFLISVSFIAFIDGATKFKVTLVISMATRKLTNQIQLHDSAGFGMHCFPVRNLDAKFA